MKFKRLEVGMYESDNGYIIKVVHAKNMFTGGRMSSREDRWHIFKNGVEVDYGFTLKDAKRIVEKLSQ